MQANFYTQRLWLNLITEEDNDFILALVNTEGWLQFIGDRNVHSMEDTIAYIKKIKSTPDLFYWVVRLQDNNLPIGIISFIKRNYLEHFDIGFAFLPEFTGQGYAFEAAAEVLSILRKEPGYSLILATTIPKNSHSIKLLTKLGFHFEKEIDIQSEKLFLYSNG